MKILLFGGTTEGRELAERLASLGHAVTACVVTDIGAEELRHIPGLDVRVGKMPVREIEALVPGYDLCVDATHPYAAHISASVRAACGAANVPLRRVLRPAGETADCTVMPDQTAAAAYLAGKNGNILLTTGAKELAAYGGIDPARLYVRILPTHEGLAACEKLGLPHRNIIAMQGPFSAALNEALFRQYDIRWLVTKDGGRAGGLAEKLTAARRADVRVVLIERPREEGVTPESFVAEMMEGSM